MDPEQDQLTEPTSSEETSTPASTDTAPVCSTDENQSSEQTPADPVSSPAPASAEPAPVCSPDTLNAAGQDADANAGSGNVSDTASTCSADKPDPVAQTAQIAVHVKADDGTPVQGVTVSVDDHGWAGVTDANGDFDFGTVPPDTYTISGQKDCFNPAPASQTLTATPGASTQHQLVLTPIQFKLQYQVNGAWKDVPTPLGPLCPGSSAAFKAVITSPAGVTWPAGAPVWGGDASGTGEQTTVTFSTSGARTVSAQGGSLQKVDVTVADPNAAIAITWVHASTVDNATANDTTKEREFTTVYEACADVANNQWHLRVKSITGGTDIAVHMGGYQTPQPGVNITTEAQGSAAITDMLRRSGGQPGGGPGTWNTEAATRAHEGWHRDEWVQSSEHYWPPTETAVETLQVPYDAHENDKAGAIAALKPGADTKIVAFKNIARQYWFTLGDSFGDRPYLAGSSVMSPYIDAVRTYGQAQTPPWTLPAGTNAPPPADHCYQPWLPYTP